MSGNPVATFSPYECLQTLAEVGCLTGGMYAVGAVWGLLAGTSIVFTGTMFGVAGLALPILMGASYLLGKGCKWSNEAIALCGAIAGSLWSVALLVTGITLGVFGPISIIAISFLTICSIAYVHKKWEDYQMARKPNAPFQPHKWS